MEFNEPLQEFRNQWIPHITDSGLQRLLDLLENRSPFLIHGSFTKVLPMGCLATHIAWHHPHTTHLMHEAGICWLTRIAHLNPATSLLVTTWDEIGQTDAILCSGLIKAILAEIARRKALQFSPTEPELV
ncbi:MAG: hypothetical protein R3B84_05935 [Zavarzinella sp.]